MATLIEKVRQGLTATEISNSLTPQYEKAEQNGTNMDQPQKERKAFKDLSPEEQERIKKRGDEIRDYFKKFSTTEILKKLGAIQSSQMPEYWKIEGFGVLKVTKDLLWEKHKTPDEKGYHGISLVQAVLGLKYQSEAVKWLKSNFKVPPAQPKPESEKKVYQRPQENINKKEEERIKKEKREALINEIKSIDIKLVFEELNAESNQDGDSSKWKISGVGNIITKNQSWKNVNNEKKGFGGIGLVQMALDMSFNQSLAWLVERFGENISDDMKADLNAITEKKEFTPPINAPYYIDIVKDYLVAERGIPSALVDKLINEGKIYADPNKRCVFISNAAAELRSTGVEPDGKIFKGCCVGSQTDLSGFRVMFENNVKEECISLVEAAIDSISYNAMFPGRFTFSTNGSGRFLLQYKITTEALDNNWKLKAAFDADWAGDLAAQKLFNAVYLRTYLSKFLKVDPEVVDEWILDNNIGFKIQESPHLNFFNEGWEESKKKLVEVAQKSEDGKVALVMEDHGEFSEPEIIIKVEKDLHANLTKGEKTFKVNLNEYKNIIDNVGLARERPLYRKDWNEVMKLLGLNFVMDYNDCAKKGFNTVPALPDYLEYYRSGVASENPHIIRNKEEVSNNKKMKI